MHHYQTAAHAATLNNHLPNQYASSPISDASNAVLNHITTLVPAQDSSQDLGDVSNVALAATSVQLISHVQQVPSTHPILTCAAQQSTQPRNLVPISTTPLNADHAMLASIPGLMTTVNMASTSFGAGSPVIDTPVTVPKAIAGASPTASGSRVHPKSMLVSQNFACNPSVTSQAIFPTTITRRHTMEAASPVPPIAKSSAPMGNGGSLGLFALCELDLANIADQLDLRYDSMQTGAVTSTPAMLTTTDVHQTSLSAPVLANRAGCVAVAAAMYVTAPAMQSTRDCLDHSAYLEDTTQRIIQRHTGKRKGSGSRTSRGVKKTKGSKELSAKFIKKEDVVIEMDAASHSQRDDIVKYDADAKNAICGNRNRQGAAASQKLKMWYVEDLEKRVKALSEVNEEIQEEQMKAMVETIGMEKEQLATVACEDMETVKLIKEVGELPLSPLAEQHKQRDETWDCADSHLWWNSC